MSTEQIRHEGLHHRRRQDSSQHTRNGINPSSGNGNGNEREYEHEHDNDDKKSNAVEMLNLLNKCEDNFGPPCLDGTTTSFTVTSLVSSVMGNHSSTEISGWFSSLSTLAFAGLSFLSNTASVNRRFNQVDTLFDQVDKRFDEVDKRFDEARSERSLLRLEKKLGRLKSDRMETNIMMLMITFDRPASEDEKREHNGKISNIEAEISQVEAQIAVVEQTIERDDTATTLCKPPSTSIV